MAAKHTPLMESTKKSAFENPLVLPLGLQVCHAAALTVILTGLVLFGAVYRPLWLGGTALLCGLLALYTAIRLVAVMFSSQSQALYPDIWSILRYHPLLVCGYALIVCWIGIQASPFTPIRWHHPVWEEHKALLRTLSDDYGALYGFSAQPEPYSSISLNPLKTWDGLLRFIGFGAAFWLGILLGQRVRLFRRSLWVVVIVSVAIAIYGLGTYLTDSLFILWQPKRFHPESLTATFLNRNHTAALFGVAIQCACACLWSRNSGLPQSQTGDNATAWRLRWVLALESFLKRDWLWLLAFVFLGTALLLTQSRAGLFTSVLGGMCLFWGASRFGIVRAGKVPYYLGALLVLGAILYSISGAGLTHRFDSLANSAEVRGSIFQLTLQGIQDNGLLGTGGHTFTDVFRLYRTPDFRKFLSEAHNEYLESLLTFGIPVAVLWFLTLVLLPIRFWQGMQQRRQYKIFSVLGLGLCLQMAVHSLVDFPLEIPALAWLVMFLMGGCLAQTHSRITTKNT